MKPLIPLALILLAGPLWAACPTIADLESGIRGTTDKGHTDTYSRLSADVIQADFSDGSGVDFRSLLGKGVYLLESIDVEKGVVDPETRTVYAFPVSPPGLPEPEPGGTYGVEVSYRFPGEDWDKERHSYSFGAEVTGTYGACSFRMIPVTTRFSGPDEAVETLHYLPELGFAYLAQYAWTEDGKREVDDYAYVSFQAVR